MPDTPGKKRARKPPKPATTEPPLVDKTKPLIDQVIDMQESSFLGYDDVVRVMGEFKVDLRDMQDVTFYVDPNNDERVVVIPRTRELPGGFALLLDRKGISELYSTLAILEDNE
jgi:hypothetical protein